MAAADGMTEVAGRASQAETNTRAAGWLSGSAIESATRKATRSLELDRVSLAQPVLSSVAPSPVWRDRLAELVAPDRDRAEQAPPDDPVAAASQAEADAEAAVSIARLTLAEAHRAVLRARAAALRAGDSEALAVRGYRPLPAGRQVPQVVNPALRYGQAVGTGTKAELSNVVATKPRPILVKLGIGLGLGLAYLLFLRVFHWDEKSEVLPYLAPYALSGVIGGVVCTNALSWDAGRVRAALTGGQRLWLVLLSKNLTMLVLVGAVGLVLCVLLAWSADDLGTLVKSIGELVTMMLLWLGVGNVMSVLIPLRVEPLKARRHDGTIRPFLLSFAISYVVGLGVNLMLTWKVWAKQSMITEMGGVWVPVLMLVFTAFVMYLLLTVLAVSLADQPRIRRKLLREMLDYQAGKQPATQA